jgi:hypothetical protein
MSRPFFNELPDIFSEPMFIGAASLVNEYAYEMPVLVVGQPFRLESRQHKSLSRIT